MKKTVALRIKHDRDYSQKLLHLASESVKMEAPSYHSAVYKVGLLFHNSDIYVTQTSEIGFLPISV